MLLNPSSDPTFEILTVDRYAYLTHGPTGRPLQRHVHVFPGDVIGACTRSGSITVSVDGELIPVLPKVE